MVGVVTALAVMATATVYSAGEQRKANKANKRARKEQQKADKLRSQKSAVEQIRQAQIARASIVQSGENQGVGGSSGVLGGAGSVSAQAAGNLGFANQVFALQQSQNRLMESAYSHQSNAQLGQAIGDVANIAGQAKVAYDKHYG